MLLRGDNSKTKKNGGYMWGLVRHMLDEIDDVATEHNHPLILEYLYAFPRPTMTNNRSRLQARQNSKQSAMLSLQV